MRDILQAQHYQLREIERYVQAVMPTLPYHNFNHVMEATSVAHTLATAYSLPAKKRFSLGAAMRLHDVVYVPGAHNNEEQSARDANRLLQLLGVDSETISETLDIILATKHTAQPQSILEQIAKDADMHNLGTPYFLLSNQRIRAEFAPMTDSAWYSSTLRNIADYKFHTIPGQMLYGATWAKNLAKLNQMVEENAVELLNRS